MGLCWVGALGGHSSSSLTPLGGWMQLPWEQNNGDWGKMG